MRRKPESDIYNKLDLRQSVAPLIATREGPMVIGSRVQVRLGLRTRP